VNSTIGIDVAAPRELVFALARDVTRWPDLLPHYVRADVVGTPDTAGRRLVRFVARRPLIRVLGLGVPVAWRSITWSDGERCELRFVHRGGATNGMDVTWHLTPTAAGTRVEIEHRFAPRVPGWAWLVDRLFTRAVAGRTLASFRAIAEAIVTSDRPVATNP
jgi:hypothetical protein